MHIFMYMLLHMHLIMSMNNTLLRIDPQDPVSGSLLNLPQAKGSKEFGADNLCP